MITRERSSPTLTIIREKPTLLPVGGHESTIKDDILFLDKDPLVKLTGRPIITPNSYVFCGELLSSSKESEVAVKIPNPNSKTNSRIIRALLASENALLTSLAEFSHPNLVQYVGGHIGRGYPFIITKWAGITLKQFLHEVHQGTRPKPTEEEAAALTSVVYSTLQFLHAQKIVIGDLKPDNILLGELDLEERINPANIRINDLAGNTIPGIIQTNDGYRSHRKSRFDQPTRYGDEASLEKIFVHMLLLTT